MALLSFPASYHSIHFSSPRLQQNSPEWWSRLIVSMSSPPTLLTSFQLSFHSLPLHRLLFSRSPMASTLLHPMANSQSSSMAFDTSSLSLFLDKFLDLQDSHSFSSSPLTSWVAPLGLLLAHPHLLILGHPRTQPAPGCPASSLFAPVPSHPAPQLSAPPTCSQLPNL